jgi:hypothetical protein
MSPSVDFAGSEVKVREPKKAPMCYTWGMTLEHRTVEIIPGEWDEEGNLLGERGDLVDPEKVKFRFEDGKFFADFDVQVGYYRDMGASEETAMNLSVWKHRKDIPEELQDGIEDGEYVKRHIPTPGKRYYGIVEWFEC